MPFVRTSIPFLNLRAACSSSSKGSERSRSSNFFTIIDGECDSFVPPSRIQQSGLRCGAQAVRHCRVFCIVCISGQRQEDRRCGVDICNEKTRGGHLHRDGVRALADSTKWATVWGTSGETLQGVCIVCISDQRQEDRRCGGDICNEKTRVADIYVETEYVQGPSFDVVAVVLLNFVRVTESRDRFRVQHGGRVSSVDVALAVDRYLPVDIYLKISSQTQTRFVKNQESSFAREISTQLYARVNNIIK